MYIHMIFIYGYNINLARFSESHNYDSILFAKYLIDSCNKHVATSVVWLCCVVLEAYGLESDLSLSLLGYSSIPIL